MIKKVKEIPEIKDPERFFKFIKIDNDSGCWEWQGYIGKSKYGNFKITTDKKQNTYQAHRISYFLFVGIPDKEKIIDHQCENRICVNPDHLKEITQSQNILRSKKHSSYFWRNMTVCPKGHPFDENNTIYYPIKKTGKTQRLCAICTKIRQERNRKNK